MLQTLLNSIQKVYLILVQLRKALISDLKNSKVDDLQDIVASMKRTIDEQEHIILE